MQLTDNLPGGSMVTLERMSDVLPSCVVSKIRTSFPDPNGVYTGFQSLDNDTEIEVAWKF